MKECLLIVQLLFKQMLSLMCLGSFLKSGLILIYVC